MATSIKPVVMVRAFDVDRRKIVFFRRQSSIPSPRDRGWQSEFDSEGRNHFFLGFAKET